MESLATVLRQVLLFTNLPPGGLARIIADLREEQHSHGTVVCYEGEAAQIFILQSLEPRRFWLTEAGISVKSLL